MNTVSAGFVTHTLRISVLIVLAILSWFATFYGMHKVILGESAGFGWGSLIIFAAAAAVMLLIV